MAEASRVLFSTSVQFLACRASLAALRVFAKFALTCGSSAAWVTTLTAPKLRTNAAINATRLMLNLWSESEIGFGRQEFGRVLRPYGSRRPSITQTTAA